MAFKIIPYVPPRLQAVFDAGGPVGVRPRQCGTCAYRGKFSDAPAEIQEHHYLWMAESAAEEGNDDAHCCHEQPEVRCAGCTRWTQEAKAHESAAQSSK